MAAKKKLRFKIGDWIVHYSYGVGKVVDIIDKGLKGHQETFFRVSTAEIEYWIPIDKVDSARIEPIRSEKDFDQAVQIIEKPPQPMTESHNLNKRLIYERWLDGSLPARAALIRDLYGRNKKRELSYDEKVTFEKAENFFINEWIITNPELSRAMARQKLNDALELSTQSGKLVFD
jgi:CarD family transcriptional regulator